jgi:hypothetical protein
VPSLGRPTPLDASESIPLPPCHAPGRAPRRTRQGERHAGPSVRRLPFRTRRPEAPYHGAVHCLAPKHEVARLFKAVVLLPA